MEYPAREGVTLLCVYNVHIFTLLLAIKELTKHAGSSHCDSRAEAASKKRQNERQINLFEMAVA